MPFVRPPILLLDRTYVRPTVTVVHVTLAYVLSDCTSIRPSDRVIDRPTVRPPARQAFRPVQSLERSFVRPSFRPILRAADRPIARQDWGRVEHCCRGLG